MKPTRPISAYAALNHRVGAALAVLLLAAVAAPAQVPGPVANDGRMFDANPSLYGGRYNAGRMMTPLIGGNPYATGNISRGLSLRSYSPISDPTSFRGVLGSDALAGFRRDAVSSGDAALGAGGALTSRLYYDPSISVATGAYTPNWQTFSRPDRPTFGTPLPNQGPLDLRLGPDGRRPALTGVPTATGEYNAGRSSIFGIGSTLGPPPAQEMERDLQARRDSVGAQRDPRNVDFRAQQPIPGVLADSSPLGMPLDAVLRRDVLRATPPLAPGVDTPRTDAPAPGGAPPAIADRPAERTFAPRPRIGAPDASVLPGYDVFNDMRLALALERDPRAAWFDEMRQALRDLPNATEKAAGRAKQDADQFLRSVIDTPVTTFSGPGPSAVNNELLKAESLMEIGDFYEAADRYEAAHMIDPTNPLPLLGRGHALLAAGDYQRAAMMLLQGLEQFPEISRFQFDLTRLVGGGKTVDLRRADLLKRLRDNEQPALRFLLGYLEYHTGQRDEGMTNLRKAAAEEKASTIIIRYPDMLQGSGPLPPPRIPSLAPERPQQQPTEPRRSGEKPAAASPPAKPKKPAEEEGATGVTGTWRPAPPAKPAPPPENEKP